MKKNVCVTIEYEYEIDIPDKALTDEELKAFSSFMFPVENADDLFRYVAEQISRSNDLDVHFVEGLGDAIDSRFIVDEKKGNVIEYTLEYQYKTAEIYD